MHITLYKHQLKVLLLSSIILTACQSAPASTITSVISTSIPTPIATTTFPTNTPVSEAPPTFTPLPPTPIPQSTPLTIDNPQLPINQSPFPTAPLPLDAYPRPPNDNGLGVHWSTHLYAQSDEATSYFVSELTRMNIKWVKLLNHGTAGRDYDHTIDELVSHDIMPVLRIYQQCNTPYDPAELDALVRHYVDKGVYYYDLYNESNQPGKSGGWCQPGGEPQPEYLAQVWADAARTIYLAGGYPSLPSFFAPNQKEPGWQDSFFYRFFHALRAQGNEDVLYFSWASIHNYNLNHPPTYPFDEVNLTSRLLTDTEIIRYKLSPAEMAKINLYRTLAGILRKRLLTIEDANRHGLTDQEITAINHQYSTGSLMGYNLYDDSTGFLHFIAYRNQFYDMFGFDIPMISTEGGATRGSGEDPRYPVVDGQTVAEWTLWSADYMLDDAPDYYFATMSWLLAQHALDYDEPIWEKDAWYHDREGDQEPVVEALKNRPQLHETRQGCDRDDADCWAAKVVPQPDANLLAEYPRPANDNGRGIHFSPTTLALHPKVVNYFMAELRAMNIKWVKILQDDLPDVTNSYLIEQLIANDIEPVMRVYKPFNEPYEHLPELVAQANELGVNYFELYNEPNLAGPAGGWREGEPISVERMVDLWILAANDVHAAGGHPSLPPLAGGGTVDDMVFLRAFLDGIRARDQEHLLPGSWLAVHNYFLNHPLDYPTDPVNVHDIPLTNEEIAERELTPEQVESINHARSIAKLPREEGGFWVGKTIDDDSNAFRKFEAYANIFYNRFGYYLPVISTEGGALVGSAEDPRYPPVRQEDLTELTLAAYHATLDDAPPYFFAHTPWLLANSAGEHFDERFEQAAWYKNREGNLLPVVEALKVDPRKNEIRP